MSNQGVFYLSGFYIAVFAAFLIFSVLPEQSVYAEPEYAQRTEALEFAGVKQNKILGVVTCGFDNTNGGTRCSLCHVLLIVNTLISFLIKLAALVFVLNIVWVGAKLIMPLRESPQKRNDAKSLLVNTFIGFILLLCAWVILNLVFTTLAGGKDADQKWYQPITTQTCENILRLNQGIGVGTDTDELDDRCLKQYEAGNLGSNGQILCGFAQNSRNELNQCIDNLLADKCDDGSVEAQEQCSTQLREHKSNLSSLSINCLKQNLQAVIQIGTQLNVDKCHALIFSEISGSKGLSDADIYEITINNCQEVYGSESPICQVYIDATNSSEAINCRLGNDPCTTAGYNKSVWFTDVNTGEGSCVDAVNVKSNVNKNKDILGSKLKETRRIADIKCTTFNNLLDQRYPLPKYDSYIYGPALIDIDGLLGKVKKIYEPYEINHTTDRWFYPDLHQNMLDVIALSDSNKKKYTECVIAAWETRKVSKDLEQYLDNREVYEDCIEEGKTPIIGSDEKFSCLYTIKREEVQETDPSLYCSTLKLENEYDKCLDYLSHLAKVTDYIDGRDVSLLRQVYSIPGLAKVHIMIRKFEDILAKGPPYYSIKGLVEDREYIEKQLETLRSSFDEATSSALNYRNTKENTEDFVTSILLLERKKDCEKINGAGKCGPLEEQIDDYFGCGSNTTVNANGECVKESVFDSTPVSPSNHLSREDALAAIKENKYKVVPEEINLKDYIKENEGYKTNVYKDNSKQKHLTVGYGHKLTIEDKEKYGNDGSGFDKLGEVAKETQINEWFTADIKEADRCAKTFLNSNHTADELFLVTDLAFNLGCKKLSNKHTGFDQFQKAINTRHYEEAAIELVRSNYYGQVKSRALKNISILDSLIENPSS